MRRLLIPLVAAAALLGAAQPAAPPDYPVNYIHVDDLKAQLDRGDKILIFDVRAPASYHELHIKGAQNLPLPQVDARAAQDVPQTGRVVLY
jgi:rhodanese-related sulfurtransferase